MTRKNYDAKKARAENTALWIMADVHRAKAESAKTVTVKIEDLAEVMSYVASIKAREKIEYAGKPLGYCRPHELRQMLNREIPRLYLIAGKTKRFNTLVSFTEVGEDTWLAEQKMVRNEEPEPLENPLPEHAG